ncbi:MAG TPA: GAF domain-containing protein [Gemmatimonadales bacterium]|jgi:GAF domain-containing protein|nr:GAF domain-containing protein [Gemmatimonadales bacterium]
MTIAPSAVEDVERLQARIETLEQERRHLLAVVEILQEIAGSLHFADVVQAVARRLGEAFGLDRCSIFLAERGGDTVRLVASYEDPSIRNYVVDLARYPELRRALETGETVFIADVATDPSLRGARDALASRRVKNIAVVPITWRRAPIGAIFLRTFRDGPAFTESDIQFCQVVASLTAKALRNAHRFERLQARRGEDPASVAADRERAALVGFLRRLLDAFAKKEEPWGEGALARASTAEVDRLVGVALTVLSQEAAAR